MGDSVGAGVRAGDSSSLAVGSGTGTVEDSVIGVFEGTEFEGDSSIDSVELARRTGVDHQMLVDSALKRLVARNVLVSQPTSHQSITLTAEGAKYCTEGSPEAQLFRAVAASDGGSLAMDAAENALGKDVVKIGMQNALKRKWLAFDKPTRALSTTTNEIQDDVANQLECLRISANSSNKPAAASISSNGNNNSKSSDLDESVLKTLKQRKLVALKTFKTFVVRRGPAFSSARAEVAAELTAEMLQSGAWESVAFKPYNFTAAGKDAEAGCLHPLLKVREQFRMIFVQMGFSEMPTDRYVESSFWNFDALFQPQQHPARDAHDTFFLSAPASARVDDAAYLQRVRDVHERGGYGSLGYQYKWSEEEAKTTILRTHTTAVSSRMLYQLARELENNNNNNNTGGGGKSAEFFEPRKYFSIDRVFRNETLDATHLAEFHQIEGLVAAKGLSLAELKGVIGEFFRRMGMTRLRFKPAHNPYTEPSMEIFSYHEGLGKWVEVGNSGVFRPEMLRPMGLPEDVRVIAWGLSLERPAMIMYGIKNIRELFGHKVDIATIRANPMCRLGMTA